MKRKLLYTIIFISIFLMSSASMVRPVQGYENPDIPAEAKNMLLDDTEVTVYDEDEMEKSLGRGFDIKDIKNGDADIVGARSQMKILDWEADEDLINYEEDFLYPSGEIEEAYATIRGTFWAIAGLNVSTTPPIADLIRLLTSYNPATDGTADYLAGQVDTLAGASIATWPVLMGLYAEDYDGLILEREIWDFLDPAEEFDNSDPDVDDDEVPYLLDPRDWLSAYENGNNLKNYVLQTCDTIQASLDSWYGYLAVTGDPMYAGLNGTVAGAPQPGMEELRWSLANITLQAVGYIDYVLGMYILATYIVQNVYFSTLYGFPDKFGLLLMLLEAGQPCASPAADFINKVIDIWDVKDDVYYRIPFISYGADFLGLFGVPEKDLSVSGIPYGQTYTTAIGVGPIGMGGETIYVEAMVDVGVDDAGTVTIEFEYRDGQIDPKDIIQNTLKYRMVFGNAYEPEPDELDDWEWIFPKGSDGDTIMKSGDTQFYVTHPMEGPIPGYETPIILGVSLASVIGLIYVIMRKRKK